MKCESHKGRGRPPKDCAACFAGQPIEVQIVLQAAAQLDAAAVAPVARKRAKYKVEYGDEPKTPRTTEDGRTWLDPDGNPPVEDANGRLLQPFRLQLVFGAVEGWGAGLRLPMPPTVLAEWVAELEASRARVHKPKGG